MIVESSRWVSHLAWNHEALKVNVDRLYLITKQFFTHWFKRQGIYMTYISCENKAVPKKKNWYRLLFQEYKHKWLNIHVSMD